jgi:hypothetical protein
MVHPSDGNIQKKKHILKSTYNVASIMQHRSMQRVMLETCHELTCALWNSIEDNVVFILVWKPGSQPWDATRHGIR